MPRLSALLLAAVLALPSLAAYGQEATQQPAFVCLPVEVVAIRAAQFEARADVTVDRFAGAEAGRFLAVLNAEEPATDWRGDTVILVRFANGMGTFALLTGDKGCMASFALPAELLKRAVAAAVGVPA